jgi:hypothetical protein
VRAGAIIDQFGDAIMCCKYYPGDTWRARHDTGKLAIVSECIDAKIAHNCEVLRLMGSMQTSSLPKQLLRVRILSGAWPGRDQFLTLG